MLPWWAFYLKMGWRSEKPDRKNMKSFISLPIFGFVSFPSFVTSPLQGSLRPIYCLSPVSITPAILTGDLDFLILLIQSPLLYLFLFLRNLLKPLMHGQLLSCWLHFLKKKKKKILFHHLVAFWKGEEINMHSGSPLELGVLCTSNILWVYISVKFLKSHIKMIFINMRPELLLILEQDMRSLFPALPEV